MSRLFSPPSPCALLRGLVGLACLILVPAPGLAASLPPLPPTDSLFLIPAERLEELGSQAAPIHHYGGSVLVRIPNLGRLEPAVASRIKRIEGVNEVSYRGWSQTFSPVMKSQLESFGDSYYLLALAGPIDAAWKTSLTDAGLAIVGVARPYGLVVRGGAAELSQAAELTTSAGYAVLRGIATIPVEARIAASLLPLARGQGKPDELGYRRAPDGRAVILAHTYQDQEPETVLQRVAGLAKRADPALAHQRRNGFLVRGPEIFRILERIPEVAFLEPVLERKLNNNLAAQDNLMNVEPIWNELSLGYDGAGVIVGVNDNGVDLTHPDFQDTNPGDVFVATSGTMSNTDNLHGTHTSGSVMGRGNALATSPVNTSGCGDLSAPLNPVRGMAWGARGTHNNIFDGGILDDFGMMQWSYQQGARLNTNSWSYCAEPCFLPCWCGPETGYVSNVRAVDQAVRDADSAASGNQELMIFFSAGNDGPDPGTISAPGNAKNVLTVGASQNNRCGLYVPGFCSGPDIDSMTCFSAQGPSQQRIKPDVVAPGSDVLSVETSDPLGDDGGLDEPWTGSQYATLSGTSMATPLTAGCGAVFHEFYQDRFGPQPSPALSKAAIINGAEDMGFGFPSNVQGWGRVNCRQSLEGPPSGEIRFFDQGSVTHLVTGQRWQEDLVCAASSSRLKVTLAWSDPAGAAGCDPCDVNDLDLVVTDPNDNVYRGNAFMTGTGWSQANPGPGSDSINNVENVFVDNPTAGGWKIEVEAAQVGANPPGLLGQDFALVYSGDCSPCAAPAAPTGLTASAVGSNRIDLGWTLSTTPGITEQHVYRATTSGGPYTRIATVSAGTTSHSDLTASGGTTYYYVVRSVLDCESPDSNEAVATAVGSCSAPPSFAGIESVTASAGSECGLTLGWTAATSNCPGEQVVYNVYRSSTPGFNPQPSNLIDACVTDTSYTDTGVTGTDPYYYVVRAEGQTSGLGGLCRDGNEEQNTTELSGLPGGLATLTLYAHDFETGTGRDDWGVGTFGLSESTADWRGIQTCTAASGTDIFRFGGNTCSANYGNDVFAFAEPATGTGISVPADATNVRLSFQHRRQFQSGRDGALLTVSLDQFNYSVVDAGALSGTTYNGTIGASVFNCPPLLSENLPVFTGTDTSFSETQLDLDAVCDQITLGTGGCAGQTVWIGFTAVTDCQTGPGFDGWFLDDVTVTAEAAAVCSAPPERVVFLTATATDGQNLVEWLNPASGPYDSTMIRYRTDTYPTDASDGTLLANQAGTLGQHDEFLHTSLTNGTSYYYSAFVQAAGQFSAAKQVWARPFDTSGPSKWAYSTAASALAPAGIGSVYGVSNDRTLHSMSSGISGGDWPSSWTPLAMNGSVQHRPGVGTVAGIKRTLLASQDGSVYMVNAATGGLIWSYDTGMLLQGAPSAVLSQYGGSYDLMFAGTREASANNGLYAFDFFPSAPPAGDLAWVFDNLGPGGDGSGGIGIISSQSSVRYDTSRIYFTSRAHPTGSTGNVWCVQISGPAGGSSAAICPTWGAARALGDVDCSSILRSNRLYVGTNSSRVHALDPDTGSDLWAAPGYTDLGDGPIKGFVAWHASRSELVASTTTKVTGLDPATGAINWQVSLASPSIPLVPFGNPFVYVGSSDGDLYEIDPTGPSLKSVALGGGTAAIGSPAWDRVNSQVVVGADDGRMYAVLVPLP